MSSEIIINSTRGKSRIGLLKEKKLVEFHQETDEVKFNVGDIYLGRIKKINKSLNASFVDLGSEKDAFLHYLDLGPQFLSLKKLVKEQKKTTKNVFPSLKKEKDINKFGTINEVCSKGDEILVQVVKEPISTKGPRVTTELSLAGRYLILVAFSDSINVSKKITNKEERSRLINLIKAIKPKNFGVIVRTNAESKPVSELDKDLQDLVSLWNTKIIKVSKSKKGDKIIGEDNKATLLLRDLLNSSFDNIIVDNKELYNEIKLYVRKFEPKKEKIVKHYSSPAPIFEVYGIEKQLESLFGETVKVPEGGYIIIQHTEALHAIDVNSGKTSKAGSQEETAIKVNLDSVKTIARQLRLRDIGGIIVIDFIDMRKISNKKLLYLAMKKAMSEDRSKHTILPLSRFCLMQITRQRVRPELKMSKEEAELDSQGTQTADVIEQTIEHLFNKQNQKNIQLIVHPYLFSYFTIGVLSRQYKWFIKYRRWVKIKQDPDLSIKDFIVLDSDGQKIETKK